MNGKCITLTPFDTLFFREGTPFTKGISNYVESLPVPNPSTVYGALFTELMRQNEELKNKVIGRGKRPLSDKELSEILTINHIYLYNTETHSILVPMPKDLGQDKYGELHLAKLVSDDDVINSSGSKAYMDFGDAKVEKISDAYVDHWGMINGYREGDVEDMDITTVENIYKKYPSTGIEVNMETLAAKDENLYIVEKVEWLPEIKLKVEFELHEEYRIASIGSVRLGGEGKVCKYRTEDNDYLSKKGFRGKFDIDKNVKSTNGYFKAVVLTPLKFEEELDNVFQEFEVVNCTTDQISKVGGFDYATKEPKKMMNCLAPGAVIYLHANGKELNSLDAFGEEAFKGFGKCIFYGVKEGALINEV